MKKMLAQRGSHFWKPRKARLLHALACARCAGMSARVMRPVNVRFKRVSSLAHVPTRGSEKAAGYDLYAAIGASVSIGPHETVLIDTGLQFEIPDGYFAAIYARSGIASKEGLRPANCTGVCDSDYRGNYIVALHNDSETVRTVEPGERIAQMVVLPYLPVVFEEAETLTDTARGAGGFGSTGKT